MCLLVLHPLKLWSLLLKQIEVLPVLDNVHPLVGNHSESIRSSAVTNWQLNLYSSGSDVSARVKYFSKGCFCLPTPPGQSLCAPRGALFAHIPLCHLGPSPVLKTSWVLYRPSVREVQIVSIFPDVAAVRQSSV